MIWWWYGDDMVMIWWWYGDDMVISHEYGSIHEFTIFLMGWTSIWSQLFWGSLSHGFPGFWPIPIWWFSPWKLRWFSHGRPSDRVDHRAQTQPGHLRRPEAGYGGVVGRGRGGEMAWYIYIYIYRDYINIGIISIYIYILYMYRLMIIWDCIGFKHISGYHEP